MKTLWSAFSFVAVVHFLALLIFIGWLWQSQRLSQARIQDMREIFELTVADAQKAAEDQAEQDQADQEAASERAKIDVAPISSSAQIRQMTRMTEHESLVKQRIRDEARHVKEQFELARAELDQAIKEFEAERDAWETSVEDERQRRTNEQFLKVVKVLEQQPPKHARTLLTTMVQNGEKETAVSYLNAMNPRTSAKILREFKTGPESQLATELLDALRTSGLVDPTQEDAADAGNAALSADADNA